MDRGLLSSLTLRPGDEDEGMLASPLAFSPTRSKMFSSDADRIELLLEEVCAETLFTCLENGSISLGTA